MGIDTEDIEKVFQLFETAKVDRTGSSTGIGLAIVKKIVDLLEGKIWIESIKGEGSAFIFTISNKFCSLDREDFSIIT